MRKIKIVSDSSGDIFEMSDVDYAYAPLKVITDEREFVDDESLDVDGMVDYLDKYKGRSRSSCPNIMDWIDAFGDSDDIFCITITSGLSGSYNSAMNAKAIYEKEKPGRRVFVIDSLSAGPQITLIIQKLREFVKQGYSYEDIVSEITEYSKKTGLIFMLRSLKTFANNGRVSPIVAKLVGLMGICIVGKASEVGTLELMHKCRGERRALETLVSSLGDKGFSGGKISIGHCQNEAGALKLKEMILEKYPVSDIEIHTFGDLCSFYAERGGILVGFEKN